MTIISRQNYARSVQRNDNLRRLVVALANEIEADQISALFGMAPSGRRKYMLDLAPVVETVRFVGSKHNQPVYRLVQDPEKVNGFLSALDGKFTPDVPGRKQKSRAKAVDPTRHVHKMVDDVPYPLKVNRVTVARDELVAALFGAPEVRV